jgi:hypothetical protein
VVGESAHPLQNRLLRAVVVPCRKHDIYSVSFVVSYLVNFFCIQEDIYRLQEDEEDEDFSLSFDIIVLSTFVIVLATLFWCYAHTFCVFRAMH